MISCMEAREVTRVSRVKVEENGRVATFINEDRSVFHKVKVDGGLVENEVAADYVVVKACIGSVIVELKGTDIEHAVDQIDHTMSLVKSCKSPKNKERSSVSQAPVAGLIICTKYPRADTAFQNKLKKFVRKHGVPIHCVSVKGEFVIERVLAFDGPR